MEAGAGGTADGAGGETGHDQGGNTSAGTGGATGTAGSKGKAGSTGTGGSAGGAGTAGSGGGSGCASACASYQFCSSNKCLPTYASTRVLPTTDQMSGYGQINSAVVLTNKAQGDIIVQFSGSSSELQLSDPGASMLTYLAGSGYARYTADGKLTWSRTIESLTGSTNVDRESAIALVPPTDFGVSYVKYEPPTGPTTGKYFYRVARINGNTGNLTWEAKYPNTTNVSSRTLFLVPRPAQGDFITLYPVLSRESGGGEACSVTDNGTAGSVTCSGSSYAIAAVPSADGTTAWIWGAPGATGSLPLNPLTMEKWAFTANPFQAGGEDAFILGVRGASTSVGAWMTEGDYGPRLALASLPGGDLAVTAEGNGFMNFNGGQSLLAQSGSVLFRIATATGQILWRTPLAQAPTSLIAAPGGRIAVLYRAASSDPSSVQVFDSTSGALLSTLPLPPSISQQVLAAGQTDLFVIGDYSSAFDFDPGSGTDKPSSTRGVYISRYTF